MLSMCVCVCVMDRGGKDGRETQRAMTSSRIYSDMAMPESEA